MLQPRGRPFAESQCEWTNGQSYDMDKNSSVRLACYKKKKEIIVTWLSSFCHTQTQTHTHTHTHARMHARTHARTHGRTDARTHAHTHKHIHIHWLTDLFIDSQLLIGRVASGSVRVTVTHVKEN